MKEDTPPTAEATSPEIHPAPVARLSVLAQIWRVLSHPAMLIALLILAAGAMALHLWLPQLPTPLAGDPAASSAWLDEIAAMYPGGEAMRALGLFNLSHNALLRVILPLLAATLIIHFINDMRLARAAREASPPTTWLPGLHAWETTLPHAPDEEAWGRACTELCHSGRMTVTRLEDGTDERVCDCHYRHQWLILFTEIGLALALVALLLNLFSGWQVDGITMNPGDSVSLAPYSDLTVRFSEDANQLILCCPETSTPLDKGGIKHGSVRVQVTDQNDALHITLNRGDKALPLQAIEQGTYATNNLIVHFPETSSERAIAAPDANLYFRLVALENGGFRVQALDAANQVLFSTEVHEETALPLNDDLTLVLRPTTFITIRAWGRPWTWLLAPALLLAAIGLIFRWRRPYWRLGALTNETGVALRWQGPRATRKRFVELIHLLTRPSPVADEEAP